MTEIATLARPYAKAAFEIARDGGVLDSWSEQLTALAGVVEHEDLKQVIGNPLIDGAVIASLFADIGGPQLKFGLLNLIKILAENRRLSALPEIARQFKSLAAVESGKIEAVLVSAIELDEAQIEALRSKLEAKWQRKVSLAVEIDPALVGGAVLRAGDRVIDGSVRGRLEQLAGALNS